MIDIDRIIKLQKQNIQNWHTHIEITQTESPFNFIEENNMWNFKLWHEEDIARILNIESLRIVEAKRNIDKYNQARNNAMEKIDEWILNYLASHQIQPSNKLHSETPGMMIDRLSIMALKHYHMKEETLRTDVSEEHKIKCSNRVLILDEQIKDLSHCLAEVFTQLLQGNLKFKVYRQLKMYNDPTLNPQLYNRNKNQ